MQSVLVVSPELEKWAAFNEKLAQICPMSVTAVRSAQEAIALTKTGEIVAAAIDQELGDMTGMDLVVRLLETDAMINVALVSDQSGEAFHEFTEGLGLLMQLPPEPIAATAVEFCKCLSGVI